MRVLGIETSCDETALSIIESSNGADITVRADKTLSQAKLHAEFGGVFPNLAKREHLSNLPMMLPAVLTEAGLSRERPELDAIAVTIGPGLEPCLWAGITFAETLAKSWNIPVVPVNHMEGHIFSALLRRKDVLSTNYLLLTTNFPALALLISGGHTELVLVKDYFDYEIIGQTRDDAVGEAFDKVARLLGLPYPGGPHISALAEMSRTNADLTLINAERIRLPRPMLHSNDFDFSFSGLKTAVLYLLKELKKNTGQTYPREVGEKSALSPRLQSLIAREFEDAVTEVLVTKTRKAIEQYGAKTLLIGGGVIANTHIRSEFEKLSHETGVALFIPEQNLTTDNALMIAVAGFLRLTLKNGSTKPQKGGLTAKGNLALDEK